VAVRGPASPGWPAPVRPSAGRTAAAPDDPEEEFQAQVTGRVAVAAFRSAVIYHRSLAARGEGTSPGVGRLLDQAFAVIGGQDPGRKDVG
jgi:hypothetical protein